MVIICIIVNQCRELYNSQISSLLYATEDVHLWRDNLRNSRHPLEECIQHWPETPARYRHVGGGAYATEVKKLAATILELICEGLGLESAYFGGKLSEIPSKRKSVLWLLYRCGIGLRLVFCVVLSGTSFTVRHELLLAITADLGFCLLTFIEGSGFSDASSAVRMKRSNTSRRARNESHASSGCIHISPLLSTPPSEPTVNMMKNDDGGFGEFDETSNNGSFRESNERRHSEVDSRRLSEGVLAPANWKSTSNSLHHVGDFSDGVGNESKVKKVKLKVGGITRTITERSASDGASADFQGFLNDLQDWELLKDTDKKMKKSQASDLIGEDGRSKGKTSAADSSRSGSGQYDYKRNFGAINHLSSSFTTDEVSVDATSEKELGNEFREAEDDCTEALNLDDHYIKAYSRRATARKEMGKLKESIEVYPLLLLWEDKFILLSLSFTLGYFILLCISSRAMAEAAKNITPPNSAYQFEVSWRGFSGDRALQTHLLKVTSPSALPQIFKNVLSVPILIDITKCVASFFIDDMDLAVKYLENLTKVPRFGVLIMCLSSTDMSAHISSSNCLIFSRCGMESSEVHQHQLNMLRFLTPYGLNTVPNADRPIT
ncbi:hypothetical protein DKX38_007036 [Salix brachista]|uniref:RNA-polymerase II-associated protein 3-like C-terminal domain-containing protein n=1 Tax=Salix brachista TaxID=2182728 RepID=A0A5N5MMB2_9ROSI|nr:hypothetical protein DKX38_007036 [Salix brachista]